jgi:hypothetical protein
VFSVSKRITVLTLVMAVGFGLAAPAWSTQDHEGGPFLRLSAGSGYALASVDETQKFEMYGITQEFNVALGGIIRRNVALHGTLWGWNPFHTEARYGSNTLGGSHDFEFVAFGPGATYYFDKSNVYLSASVGLCTINVSVELPEGSPLRDTARGYAFDFTLGKEWWKSDNWGVGFAGNFGYLNVENSLPDANEVWSGGHLGLRLSATYN